MCSTELLNDIVIFFSRSKRNAALRRTSPRVAATSRSSITTLRVRPVFRVSLETATIPTPTEAKKSARGDAAPSVDSVSAISEIIVDY